MEIVVDLKKVSVRYGASEALKDISCQVERGDFVGLVGPNGGGKTTLAKAVLGLLPLSSGEVSLFGSKKSFRDFKKIGYLPQKYTSINPLFPASVREVVSLGLLSTKKMGRKIEKEDWQKIDMTLDGLGVLDLKDKLLSELSGGQMQKVLLARALVSNPELLVLDEPSTALDPNSREYFFARLKELNEKEKTTIILITHDTGYIGQYANKLLYVDHRLVFYGKINDFCPTGDVESCFEKSDKHIIWHQHN